MFFKRKEKEIVIEDVLSPADKETFIKNAEELIKELPSKSGDDRIECLNQIGIQYCDGEEYDLAISYLETSLNEKKETGQGYRVLLKIYNIKRKNAAMQKDDKQLQYYLEKIDEMMSISKEVLRSNL
ncbi:MAG: hypothetical protein RSC93_11355 [Erysipelotrichaceae bacterium]